MLAVPLVLAWNVSPAGRAPCSLMTGVGLPEAMITKLLTVPASKVAVVGLVTAGAWVTLTMRCWVTVRPFLAVMVSEKSPGWVGVPAIVAVPLPLAWKVSPTGRAPCSLTVGVGVPVAVTAKLLAVPVAKVAVALLVTTGVMTALRWAGFVFELGSAATRCAAAGFVVDEVGAAVVRGEEVVGADAFGRAVVGGAVVGRAVLGAADVVGTGLAGAAVVGGAGFGANVVDGAGLDGATGATFGRAVVGGVVVG